MDIKTRLTRKPVTTALWLVLVTAMALFLSVGCALMYSSGSLAGILDDYYTSIAVRTDRANWSEQHPEGGVSYTFEDISLYEEDVASLKALAGVEDVFFHTMSGALIPELTPALKSVDEGMAYNQPYCNAIISGEITQFYQNDIVMTMDMSPLGMRTDEPAAQITFEIRVEEYALVNSEWARLDNPQSTDEYVNLSLLVIGQEGIDLLQEGQRYVFYGEYSSYAHGDGRSQIHPWMHPYGFAVLNDGVLRSVSYNYDHNGMLSIEYVSPVAARLDGDVQAFLNDPQNGLWQQQMEIWEQAQHSFPVIGTQCLQSMYAFVNNDANIVAGRYFTDDEYASGEKVCIISETVATKSGIQLGDTVSLSQFLCHDGSTENVSLDPMDPDGKLNNPHIGSAHGKPLYQTEDEKFVVVGLYRQTNEWADGSYSITPNTVFIPQKTQIDGAFGGMSWDETLEYSDEQGNPYTISVTHEGGTFGIYFSIKLKNGFVNDFVEAAEASAWAGEFITVDQGFGDILERINEICATSMKLFILIAAGWALLLLLYLLLYQGSQRQNLGIMRSLGASPKTVQRYLFGSGMAVATIGVGLGAVLTGAVMRVVQNKLFETTFAAAISEYSNAVLSQDAINQMVTGSQLPVWAIIVIAAGQILVFAAVLWFQACRLSEKSARALLSK